MAMCFVISTDCQSTKFSHKYNVLVSCRHGHVEGFSIPSHYAAYHKQRINVFLGIPYAKRISEYSDWRRQFRFNRPESPSWVGIWNATYYRPACPQLPWLVKQTVPEFNREKHTSEDCLYLNIFSPNNTDETPVEYPNLYPVIVFIHGGGWTMGASQQYPGVFLAERKVVVVTFNYRLNALGFLSTGDHYSPGNYGLWDQHRALEFIKENIKSFRGDPGHVTIIGHSTGAASAGLHLLSPRSYNLFHQAILMSGSDRSKWAVIPDINDAKNYAIDVGRELGCPTNDNLRLITCLQLYRTADEIVNASAKVRVKEGTVGNPWGPVVDGPYQGSQFAFLTDPPKSMREQGRLQKLRVMAGQVSDEGSFFIPNLPSLDQGVRLDEFNNIIREFLRDHKVADMVNAQEALTFQYTYWPEKGNTHAVRQQLMDMMSDYLFGTGMDETIYSHTLYNKTYFYVFDYKSRFDNLPPWRGVAHGQELQYLFGFPYINQTYKDLFGVYPRQQYDIDFSDRNVSEYMISLFTNFSDSGNPTQKISFTSNYSRIPWLEYNIHNHSYIYIGNKTKNDVNYRQENYAFWREYFVAVSNRDNMLITYGSPTQTNVSHYEVSTWTLTAVTTVLVVLVVALIIVICRMKPRDY